MADILDNQHPLIMSPTVVTVLASYKCTAACQHCCFGGNSGIKARMSLKQILHFVDEARRFETMRLIVFSGGECFLLGKELDAAIRHATNIGLPTRVVTNGYWARTERRARERIAQVKEAGLKEINFSTGDFHQEFVPKSAVINGALAALEQGLSTVIVVEIQKERKVTATQIKADPRIAQALGTRQGKLLKIIESPWMPMSLGHVVPQRSGQFLNRFNVHNRKGCQSILTTLVATPNGRMGICCGLSRELIPELNFDMTADISLREIYRQGATEFMKIWLFVEGPERILAWAVSKDPTIDWEGKYAHHCHACLALFEDGKVRDVIQNHYAEKVQEVLLRYSLLVRSGPVESPELWLHGSDVTP